MMKQGDPICTHQGLMVSRLSVDLRIEIREQFDEAVLVAMKTDPDHRLKQREIVEAALRKWLIKHENQTTGAENWNESKARAKVQVEVDDDLHNRSRTEAFRRKSKHIGDPKSIRALVECAIIEWLMEKKYWPKLPETTTSVPRS